jgi:arsenate reductase
MTLKVYEYNRCNTCRNALKYLSGKNIAHEAVPIRETPPSIQELNFMLKQTGNIKRLLNTSGLDYRKLNMKDKLKTMSEDEVIELLSKNGNLIKRPFILNDSVGTTGFKEDEWDKIFN